MFAANDPMAIGAVYACRDAGLDVPRDISIVGAGNIEGIHHPNPLLTTLDWSREEVGRKSATILLELIRGPTRRDSAVAIFPPSMVVRQSIAGARYVICSHPCSFDSPASPPPP